MDVSFLYLRPIIEYDLMRDPTGIPELALSPLKLVIQRPNSDASCYVDYPIQFLLLIK